MCCFSFYDQVKGYHTDDCEDMVEPKHILKGRIYFPDEILGFLSQAQLHQAQVDVAIQVIVPLIDDKGSLEVT